MHGPSGTTDVLIGLNCLALDILIGIMGAGVGVSSRPLFSSDRQASLGALKAWLIDPLLFGFVTCHD